MDQATQHTELARLHPESYGWALHCCQHDRQEAEEVLQTVYLKVLDGRAHYRGKSQFKTWLFGVIRLTAASERRRHFFRRFWLSGYGRRAEGRLPVETPDAAFDRAERRNLLREALAQMSRRQRQLLQLTFYHDLSLAEAASVLGISLGAARTHYERGKQSLRKRLHESQLFEQHEYRGQATQRALS